VPIVSHEPTTMLRSRKRTLVGSMGVEPGPAMVTDVVGSGPDF
jgi:hypothetical protein